MKTIKALVTTIALAGLPFAAIAQEEEDAPEMYTYASYFQCGGGPMAAADEVIAADAERLNGLVDDGAIAHWGWLSHHTGGKWQRIFYHQADSLDALLDGSDAIADTGDDDEEAEDDGPTFTSVCNQHDDYIWQVENGNGGDKRGEAGFSVYHICDASREERADELIGEHVAPILNGMVKDGSLTSWGWSSHVVGGPYRRLQTMTGKDHKSLLAARSKAIEAIYADDNELGAELDDICGEHVDYMWNIVHEK